MYRDHLIKNLLNVRVKSFFLVVSNALFDLQELFEYRKNVAYHWYVSAKTVELFYAQKFVCLIAVYPTMFVVQSAALAKNLREGYLVACRAPCQLHLRVKTVRSSVPKTVVFARGRNVWVLAFLMPTAILMPAKTSLGFYLGCMLHRRRILAHPLDSE